LAPAAVVEDAGAGGNDTVLIIRFMLKAVIHILLARAEGRRGGEQHNERNRSTSLPTHVVLPYPSDPRP
jgi:hypothetical protein